MSAISILNAIRLGAMLIFVIPFIVACQGFEAVKPKAKQLTGAGAGSSAGLSGSLATPTHRPRPIDSDSDRVRGLRQGTAADQQGGQRRGGLNLDSAGEEDIKEEEGSSTDAGEQVGADDPEKEDPKSSENSENKNDDSQDEVASDDEGSKIEFVDPKLIPADSKESLPAASFSIVNVNENTKALLFKGILKISKSYVGFKAIAPLSEEYESTKDLRKSFNAYLVEHSLLSLKKLKELSDEDLKSHPYLTLESSDVKYTLNDETVRKVRILSKNVDPVVFRVKVDYRSDSKDVFFEAELVSDKDKKLLAVTQYIVGVPTAEKPTEIPVKESSLGCSYIDVETFLSDLLGKTVPVDHCAKAEDAKAKDPAIDEANQAQAESGEALAERSPHQAQVAEESAKVKKAGSETEQQILAKFQSIMNSKPSSATKPGTKQAIQTATKEGFWSKTLDVITSPIRGIMNFITGASATQPKTPAPAPAPAK